MYFSRWLRTDVLGCNIGPSFFHRAARDLVGRLTRQGARFAAIPHAMACFGAPARDTWAARGEHHEHPARALRPMRRKQARRQAQANVFGGREGYRKASNRCPRARNDADEPPPPPPRARAPFPDPRPMNERMNE